MKSSIVVCLMICIYSGKNIFYKICQKKYTDLRGQMYCIKEQFNHYKGENWQHFGNKKSDSQNKMCK